MNLSDFQRLSLVQVRNNLANMNQFLNLVAALEVEGRDDLLLTYDAISQIAKTVKEIEQKLRVKTVKACFPNPKEKGTQTLKLGAGWSVKGKFGKTYKVDANTIKDSLAKVVHQFNIAGQAAIEGLITYDPKLSEKVYDTLSDEIKAIIDESLTIKPSTPSIELLPPKES